MIHAVPVRPVTPIDVRGAVIASLTLAGVMTTVFTIRDDAPVWRITLVLASVIALTSWLVFGVVVRRALAHEDADVSARRACALGVITFLSVLVFWLAVPPILAIGTFVLARRARSSHPGSTPWPVALGSALAGLGLLAGLILSVAP